MLYIYLYTPYWLRYTHSHLYLHQARVTRLHFLLQAKTQPTCEHIPTVIQHEETPKKDKGVWIRKITPKNNPDKFYQRHSTEPYVQMPMQR